MPPQNFDPKSKRNKIVLGVVLLVVLVVVVSLLGMGKESGMPPVANENTNGAGFDREAMIRNTTASSPSSFTSAEKAAIVKSISGTKKSSLTEAERAELAKLVSGK